MKLIKLFALVAAALLVSTSTYSVGEGSWECLWGTNCGDGGSYDTDGDGIIDPGNSFEHVMFRSEDTSPTVGASFHADAVVHGNSLDNAWSAATNHKFVHQALSTIYIHDCWVSVSAFGTWEPNDTATYVAYEYIRGAGPATYTAISGAPSFTIMDEGDTCPGAYNCVADITSMGIWQVRSTITAAPANTGVGFGVRFTAEVENTAHNSHLTTITCQIVRN